MVNFPCVLYCPYRAGHKGAMTVTDDIIMSNATLVNNTTETNKTPAINYADFGKGRYSPLMEDCYRVMVKYLKLDEAHANKLAKLIGTDFGQAMQQAEVNGKVSKPSKDGKINLSESGKLKGLTATNPLSLKHALQWIDEANTHGVSIGLTKWQLNEALTEWVTDMAPVSK